MMFSFKKIINTVAFLLSAAVLLCFSGCEYDSIIGDTIDNLTDDESITIVGSAAPSIPSGEEYITQIEKGGTMTVLSCDVTFLGCAISRECIPDNISGDYSIYSAKSKMICVDIDVHVHNASSFDLNAAKVMMAWLSYDGKDYTASNYVEDAQTGFKNSAEYNIAPGAHADMRYIIECPEKIKSLKMFYIVFLVREGVKYKYPVINE